MCCCTIPFDLRTYRISGFSNSTSDQFSTCTTGNSDPRVHPHGVVVLRPVLGVGHVLRGRLVAGRVLVRPLPARRVPGFSARGVPALRVLLRLFLLREPNWIADKKDTRIVAVEA